VVVWSRFYTRLGTTVDNIRSNDTLWQPTYFVNYYAYDDGTAEGGYGIKNAVGKVALRYDFAKPDSLYGLAVHFNRSVNDVSTLPFNLMVWKSVSLTSEEPILNIPANAVYYNARNGFYYVKFNQPIYVTNEVFIGWEQNQQFELNVGLDLNFKFNQQYAPNPEMFYNVQGLWQLTDLPGALMMRPIVGKWIDLLPVGKHEFETETLHVTCYPNPNQGNLFISGSPQKSYTISVVDLMGKVLFNELGVTHHLNLNNLNDGLYLVHIKDEKSEATTVQKVILQR
jgi:predicted heme/steroid binding protein